MTELSEDNLRHHMAKHGHLEKRPHSWKSDVDSTDSMRRTPTQRGSAKFKRIPSPSKSVTSMSSVEDKFNALSSLLQDRLLITEFPGKHASARNYDDDKFDEEFPDEIPQSGRVTKEGDYDTDLEMDYDGIFIYHTHNVVFSY